MSIIGLGTLTALMISPMTTKKKAEFVYDAEKHVRIGEQVYDQADLPDAARTEIGLIHWIDQKCAEQQAQLNTMRDGRAVAVQRMVVSLNEIEPVFVEPAAEQ